MTALERQLHEVLIDAVLKSSAFTRTIDDTVFLDRVNDALDRASAARNAERKTVNL